MRIPLLTVMLMPPPDACKEKCNFILRGYKLQNDLKLSNENTKLVRPFPKTTSSRVDELYHFNATNILVSSHHVHSFFL
jgi:hypothetical protein